MLASRLYIQSGLIGGQGSLFKSLQVPSRGVSSKAAFFYYAEFQKEAGKKWSSMPEEEKKEYEDLCVQEKARFKKDADEFFAKRSFDQAFHQKLPARLLELDPLKVPNLPLRPFPIYMTEKMKDKIKGVKVPQYVKELAQLWKTLPQSETQIYELKAEQSGQQFLHEWKAFKDRFEEKMRTAENLGKTLGISTKSRTKAKASEAETTKPSTPTKSKKPAVILTKSKASPKTSSKAKPKAATKPRPKPSKEN